MNQGTSALPDGKNMYTPVDAVTGIYDRLQSTFYSGKTRDVRWRKDQLKSLTYLIKDNMAELSEAIRADLGRSHNETFIVELAGLQNEIITAVHSVDKWSKPERPSVSFDKKILSPTIYKEPKGVALIIGTWNYPVSLSLSPLCGAIAAGCPAVLKCSEVASHSGALLARLVPRYLDEEAYTVVLGEVDVATKLLSQPWAHIFYTGNANIARVIATAAAKTLTPITLELGGKSPVFIDPDLDDVDTAVKRILWGKRVNCGQTCLAPDYIVVTESKKAALLASIQKEYARLFPKQDLHDDDYPRISSHNHFDRLQEALQKTKGTVVHRGQVDREQRMMGVSIVDDVSWDDELMKSEIFGPILPIITVKDVEAATAHLQGQTPLTLYVFSQRAAFIDGIRSNTQSGAILVNDTLIHFAIEELPFGGIGQSGMGSYHGKKSFDTFTHERASLKTPFWAEFLFAVRYFPYTDRNNAIFRTTQLKKINFARPQSSKSTTALSASTLVRYALLAGLFAVAAKEWSWIMQIVPKYKLVRVE